MKKIFQIFAIAIIINGCGYSDLPEPTQKKISTEDIVGIWQYPANYGKTIISIELNIDGAFTQIIKHSGQKKLKIHKGTWELDVTSPKLTVLKPAFGDSSKPWVLEEAHWWIVDSHQKGIKFAIFGAADDRDADSCNEFKKIR